MKRFLITLVLILNLKSSIIAQAIPFLQVLPDCDTSCLIIERIGLNDDIFVYQHGGSTRIYQIDYATNNITQYDIGSYFSQRGYLLDFVPLANYKVVIAEVVSSQVYLTLVDLQLAQSISLTHNAMGIISPCGQVTGSGMGEPRNIFLYDNDRIVLCSRENNREAYFNLFRLENNSLIFEQKSPFGSYGEVPTYPANWVNVVAGLDTNFYIVPTSNNSILNSVLPTGINSLDSNTLAVLSYNLTSQSWAGQVIDIPASRPELVSSNRVREIELIGVDETSNIYFIEQIRNESLAVVASSLIKFSSIGEKLWELTESDLGGIFDNVIISGENQFSIFFSDNSFLRVELAIIDNFSLLDLLDNPIVGYTPLVEGAAIDIVSIGTSPLNLRANPNPATVGSVVFDLNGAIQTDDTSPYEFTDWTPAPGQYTLTATPYSEAGGMGTGGIPLTINFIVIESIVCSATVLDTPSLLAAITSANATPEADTICLEAGTYTLTISNNSASDGPNGLPVITSDITQHGLGSGATIFRDSAASAFRILKVDTGARLVLENVTVSGGDAGSGSGGGIRNLGTLELRDSVVENNLPDDLSGEGTIIQAER